jgi:redox-sensitive bicupin YhaK (pirin superfamily)
MNTKAQREIAESWRVQLQKKSKIHTAGFILPAGNWEKFDPFLIMAEDIFKADVFGTHPHRGVETITYVIDGILHHKDNRGGEGYLQPGDAQWMTTGRGIMHDEAPPEDETVHILQLWLNLPEADKMTAPRYQDIHKKDTLVRKEDGVTYRLYSGSSVGLVSPTKNHVPVTMIEMEIEKSFTAHPDLPSNYNGFLYVVEGSGTFGKNEVKAEKGMALLLDPAVEDPSLNELTIKAQEKLRVILYAGKPLKEPVVAHGPFVMNSEEEIKQAYADFRAGKF